MSGLNFAYREDSDTIDCKMTTTLRNRHTFLRRQFLLVIDFFSCPGPLRLGASLVCHRDCASESSADRCQAFKLPCWTGPAGRSSGSDSDLGPGIQVVQDHDREPASE